MTMKASELVKKLGSKLLGKKSETPAAGDLGTLIQLGLEEKAPEIDCRVHDGLGVIQLHENWRN